MPMAARTQRGFAAAFDGAGRAEIRLTAPVDAGCERALAASIGAWLGACEAPLVYAAVGPGASPYAASALAGAGMAPLGALVHLTRSRRLATPIPWPAGISVAPAVDASPAALVAAIDASLVAALDWPELQGAVPTGALLVGLHGAGQGPGDQWWIARDPAGAPAGAVLLSAVDDDTVTLAFIGLAPALRGVGLGCALLSAALSRLDPPRDVVAAIDARNTPSMRMMAALGFREHRRDALWIHPPLDAAPVS